MKTVTHSGFTHLEIMVSLIIVGIIAAIGIPKYYDFVERAYVTNAKKYIFDVYAANLRYNVTHTTNKFPLDQTLLDVEFSVLNGYRDISPKQPPDGLPVPYSSVAVLSIQRQRPSPNNYTLTLLRSGHIICENGGLNSTLCEKLGLLTYSMILH